ncbi:MAG: TraB/GumN family protein [Myxococcales bacterium]|nr:TraB/GumN family protein [Myxococcales bacterium]
MILEKAAQDSSDVHRVEVDGREFVLVGTAHISRESADLAVEVIAQERPDVVCLELDPQRYAALTESKGFEALDLREVLRKRQLATLLLNLLLSTYQRQLGLQLGVLPGTEFLEAARVAEHHDIPVALCDRDVRITLRRAWRSLRWWKKLWLLSGLLASVFEKQELSEDDLRELRQQDVLSRVMEELGSAFPNLKRVLIDERDLYLAERMRASEGRRVVAVVGAGHVAGMLRALASGTRADLSALEEIPGGGRWLRILGWAIPALILSALGAIAWQKGAAAVQENVAFWVLANAIPSAAGTALALGHPLTILAAFAAAPITSLTPVIGAGYVTAFVQSFLRPPLVSELRRVAEDAANLRGWYRNRLLRIFLVFLLSTLGSVIGTWVGGAEILSNLF